MCVANSHKMRGNGGKLLEFSGWLSRESTHAHNFGGDFEVKFLHMSGADPGGVNRVTSLKL